MNTFTFNKPNFKKRKRGPPPTKIELEEMKKKFFDAGGKIKKLPKYARTPT